MYFRCTIKFMKNFLKSIIFILVVISIGMLINTLTNSNKQSNNFSDGISGFKGIGFFVSNPNDNLHSQIIDWDMKDDYKYSFNNKTGTDLNCNLNVFVTGTQIKLLNTETKDIEYNYKFSIENNEVKEIPVSLLIDDLPDGSYICNFNIVTDYDKYAVDNSEKKVWTSSNYTYMVGIKNNNTTIVPPQSPIVDFQDEFIKETMDYSQFIVNNNKIDFENNSPPKNYIEAPANSIVEVPLIIGGGPTTESLVYATLDNTQILLNNSTNLIYKLKENLASVANVEIQVPEKTGKYELILFSINNFTNKYIDDLSNVKLSTSQRITLISK